MTYDKGWYEGLASIRPHSERALFGVFALLGRPATFCDMGCGDGYLVYAAQVAGVPDVLGIEVSRDVLAVAPAGTPIRVHDLGTPLDLDKRFDLVLSWEVGEHLPEQAADTFAENLARHTGGHLVFTAAIVGQGGYEHINCQPPEYWREKLTRFGLDYSHNKTEDLRVIWRYVTGPLVWLPQNVQVFEKRWR